MIAMIFIIGTLAFAELQCEGWKASIASYWKGYDPLRYYKEINQYLVLLMCALTTDFGIAAECYCSCHQKSWGFRGIYELSVIIIYLCLFSGQDYLPALLLRYAADDIWGLSLSLVFSGSLKTAFLLPS